MLKRYLNDESGQAMSEYGLLIAVVGVALIGIVFAFRNKIGLVFSRATGELDTKTNETTNPAKAE